MSNQKSKNQIKYEEEMKDLENNYYEWYNKKYLPYFNKLDTAIKNIIFESDKNIKYNKFYEEVLSRAAYSYKDAIQSILWDINGEKNNEYNEMRSRVNNLKIRYFDEMNSNNNYDDDSDDDSEDNCWCEFEKNIPGVCINEDSCNCRCHGGF